VETLRAGTVSRIGDIAAADWNRLDADGNPFLGHAFLSALESSGCVGDGTGWEPLYLTLHDDSGLAAAAPAWIKTHSYGEFVFDFAWAQAYSRHGLRYYPKLVVAAPFTPATGPRLLVRHGLDHGALAPALLAALAEVADRTGLSSTHVLFPRDADRATLAGEGWLLRRDCQFHWSNRGYASFEEFLAGFTAEKRKKARRERRRVVESGISFDTRLGSELGDEELAVAWELHRLTFLRHGHEPYLNLAFFAEAARTMGDRLMFKLARHEGRIVAAAIFFIGADTLYGRYWGAREDFHSLHFETCYHQGVEFCIERGLARFEPGTQGEHKVARGFEPALTWSAHRIGDGRFRAAIADYLRREAASVDEYAEAVRGHVPFRESRGGSDPETE
jgi:predicted N-acyltransferase